MDQWGKTTPSFRRYLGALESQMISWTRISRAGSPLRKAPAFGTQFPCGATAVWYGQVRSGQIIVRGLSGVWRWTAHLQLQLDRKGIRSALLCSSDTVADPGLLKSHANKQEAEMQKQPQPPPGKVIELLLLRIRGKLMPRPHRPTWCVCPSMMWWLLSLDWENIISPSNHIALHWSCTISSCAPQKKRERRIWNWKDMDAEDMCTCYTANCSMQQATALCLKFGRPGHHHKPWRVIEQEQARSLDRKEDGPWDDLR